MKPVPITIESDGLDLECFEKELRKLPIRELTKRRPFKAAAYLIPTYHNPTGCCYSTGISFIKNASLVFFLSSMYESFKTMPLK